MAAAKLRSGALFQRQFGQGEANVQFDNSGVKPMRVPGFGLPVDIELRAAERFAHGANDWAQPRLTAREVAMLRLMNRLTDFPGWQQTVRDESQSGTLDAWRQEALTDYLISPASWEWILHELRDKAEASRLSGLIPVLDSASCVVKSDVILPTTILDQLRSGTSSLLRKTSGIPQAQPITDLIDPRLFPLVFGRTKVLSEGGTLTLANALESIGQGYSSSDLKRESISQAEVAKRLLEHGRIWEHWRLARPYRHSCHSQWLPCEVSFTGEQGSNTVQVTSYINNLHPVSHQSLYRAIEVVISSSIPLWNEVLVRRDRPRKPPRIRCYGVPFLPPYPPWAYGLPAIERDKNSGEYVAARAMVEQYLSIPNLRTREPGLPGIRDFSLDKQKLSWAMRQKHLHLKTGWTHPEPGQAFTYAEWKAGKGSAATVPRLDPQPGGFQRPVLREPDHEFYTVSLQETFREQGLQVVVRVFTVPLTPENPTFPGTDWHVDGLLNDHIVASSILCLSSVNTTTCSLSFRVEADLDPREHTYEPRNRANLAAVLDVPSADYLGADGYGGAALQDLDTVFLPESRLVAMPNVLQQRMGQFGLEDAARGGGHKTFLVLYLVDPHYRVCSTRNVPPQQHEWWWEASGGDRIIARWATKGVPQEVADKIGRDIGEWPMGMEEASRVREARIYEEMLGNAAVQDGVQKYSFHWD